MLHEKSILPVGAYGGISGALFFLTECFKLWNDKNLINLMNEITMHYPQYIEKDDALDIITGAAGGILGLVYAKNYINSDLFKVAIKACVDWIFKMYPIPSELSKIEYHNSKQPLLGFSHGTSGFIYSLKLASQFMQDNRINHWIKKALTYERQYFDKEKNNWPDFRDFEGRAHRYGTDNNFMTAWCHGAPGIALSRIGLLNLGYHDDLIEHEIEAGIRNMFEHGFTDDNFCLCHGLFGNLDIALIAYQKGYISEQIFISLKTKVMQLLQEHGMHFKC